MSDLTEAEMGEILKALGKTKLAEKVKRLIDEVKRRRSAPAPPAQNPQGGKHHEVTLSESVGAQEK